MKQYSLTRTEAKGFTLIELLVVIAIIGVLAAVVLLAINPAELLRKSRDSTRLSDMANIKRAIDVALSQNTPWTGTTCTTAGSPCVSSLTSTTRVVNGTGYIPIALTGYLPTLPVDPSQGSTTARVTNGQNATSTSTVLVPATGMRYEFLRSGDSYEVRTMLESTSNYDKAANDGGNNNGATAAAAYFEVGSDLTLL